jgi:NADPH:quinone reductase-like Zn-dependent oxidoreductase
MKAILQNRYGAPDVLELGEVPKPVPKDKEVLVRVHAASANALDWRPFTMWPIFIRLMGGLRKPRDPRLGADLAGRVEAIGSNVTRFQPGDEVFGVAEGAFAEYACGAENKLARKPANVSYEAAAAVPVAGLTALQGLRDRGGIQAGQTVLIHGASGGVGTFAVQIAKSFGAEVTAVCSARNMDMVRGIGADHVIDYTREDITRNGHRYDLIAAVNGHRPILHYWRALAPGGTCIVLGGSMAQILQGLFLGPLLSRTGSKRIQNMLTRTNQKDLVFLGKLLEDRKIVPVIDRTYPLGKVAEAITYLIEEHARGKVVITIDHDGGGQP